MIYKVCTLLLLASCVLATKLCLPDQLEGVHVSLTGSMEGLRMENTTFHLDYINQRFVTVTVREESGHVSKKRKLITFPTRSNGFEYTQDMLTGKCSVLNRKMFMPKICLPDTAIHLGDGYLGPYGILKVSIYNMARHNMNITTAIYVDGDNNMIPVSEVVNGTHRSGNFMAGMAFYNMTSNIRDENVFELPLGCADATVPGGDTHVHRTKRSFFGA